jgi:hypothetical protein
MKNLQESDIVIDQLLVGWYGVFAVEAMAYGKIVLCYLDDSYYADSWPPIINTNKDDVYETLVKVLKMTPEDRMVLGKKSRQFVETIHDGETIVKSIIQKIT